VISQPDSARANSTQTNQILELMYSHSQFTASPVEVSSFLRGGYPKMNRRQCSATDNILLVIPSLKVVTAIACEETLHNLVNRVVERGIIKYPFYSILQLSDTVLGISNSRIR